MKNLLLGYFHTPENKRPEVIHVLGNLVGFSQDEIDQVIYLSFAAQCIRIGIVHLASSFGQVFIVQVFKSMFSLGLISFIILLLNTVNVVI